MQYRSYPGWRMVWALAVTKTISYGLLYLFLRVAKRTRPTAVAVTVSGGDLILVIRGPG